MKDTVNLLVSLATAIAGVVQDHITAPEATPDYDPEPAYEPDATWAANGTLNAKAGDYSAENRTSAPIGGGDYFYQQMERQRAREHSEQLYYERQRQERFDGQNIRSVALGQAVIGANASASQVTVGEVVTAAEKFYTFLADGKALPNLGCATTRELTTELAVRMQNPDSAQADYRSVD